MTPLCKPIESLSGRLWHYLSDVFAYKLRAAEIGITYHLVYFITSFYKGRRYGLEVYMLNAKNEKHRGADIDLFIQMPNGRYRHYMLQSKVSSANGTFLDIKAWDKNAQYRVLLNRARKEGATAYYLLYSGLTRFSSSGNKSYGFSCVHANEIQTLKKDYYFGKPGSTATIKFDTLWARGRLFPFHRLFCVTPSRFFHSARMEHDGKSIYRGYPYEKIELMRDSKLMENDPTSLFADDAESDLSERADLARFRIIVGRG
jgi:hypothetical protein